MASFTVEAGIAQQPEANRRAPRVSPVPEEAAGASTVPAAREVSASLGCSEVFEKEQALCN